MKANAPEKIYLSAIDLEEVGHLLTESNDRDDVEYVRTDAFVEKAKKAFCKASCNGHPPRSTCTSLGTCKKYDEFIKTLKGE